MGNVAFLLDSDGDGVERYTYDAFGQPTVTEWNGQNPRTYSWYGNRFMFTGREYFAGLGLYDYRNRFYHPILGRFLQSDPMGFRGGDANFFRYCGGDPVNRSDSSGLISREKPHTSPPVPIKPLEPKPPISFGSNGYTPIGSHIPQSVYGIPNGSGFDLFTRDAVNGDHQLGTFLLIGGLTDGKSNGGSEGGGAQFVRALTPADLLSGFYGNFGDKLKAAITQVFGADASKVPAQTIANAPIVLLVSAEQMAQLSVMAVGTTAGYVNEQTTFGGDTPNGMMYILADQTRMESFRSYGHELGNLLDMRYFGAPDVHSNPNIKWDWDTGAALEEALFGRPAGY